MHDGRSGSTIASMLALATLAVACHRGGSPRVASGTGASTVSVRMLVEDPARYEGQAVTVDGVVVGSALGCLDMVCETASGCCGTCSGEARLAASGRAAAKADPEQLLWLSAAPGHALAEGFGRCRDTDSCALSCEPPHGARVRVRGTVHDTGVGAGLLVTEIEVH